MANAHSKPRHNKFKDLTGLTFGRLTVIQFKGLVAHRARWQCQCECGGTKDVATTSLTGGMVRSCGCLSKEQSAKNGRAGGKHLLYGSPDYRSWLHMIQRCENPNDDAYDRYGGRGICVCVSLRESVANLVAAIGRRPTGMSIDRFPDTNGHYSCGNCSQCRERGWTLNIRWATATEQARNRRKARPRSLE